MRKPVGSQLTKLYYEMKTDGENERSKLRVDITRVKNQLKGIIPFTCTIQDCKLRKVMVLAEESEDSNRKRRKPKDIEPSNEVV